jgi:hypothetical protein
MTSRITRFIAPLLVLACALPALAADPSPAQVYQAARGGNLAAAQQMIAQVLRDHPRSGQAHYVAAEIDARAGNFGLARQELRTAQSLEPGLPFAKRDSVRRLERALGQAPGAGLARPVASPRHSSHLGLFLLLIGGAVVLWLVLRRRAAATGYPAPEAGPFPAQYSGQYPGQYPGAVPPGMAPGAYGPGSGSGIMGSVASGLAMGAGVAAGEELVQHMMGGGSPAGGGFVPSADASQLADPNSDMGGNDFGLNDPGSWGDGGDGGGFDDGGGGDGGGWS